MEILVPVIVIGVVGLIAVIVLLVRHYEKQRTEGLRAAADDMRFAFSVEDEEELMSYLQGFHLFSQGHSKKIRNVLRGTVDEIDVTIFDYRYTTGGGKNSHTHAQTVVHFCTDRLSLPFFTLRPEHIFHKIGEVLGFHDIDFEANPDFSKQYLLKGKDEQAIREAFGAEVLEYFQYRRGLSTEAGNNQLIFYRHGKKVSPVEVRLFLEEGYEVCRLFVPRGEEG